MVYIAFLVATSVFIVVWLLLHTVFSRKIIVAERVNQLAAATVPVAAPQVDGGTSSDGSSAGGRLRGGRHSSKKSNSGWGKRGSRGQKGAGNVAALRSQKSGPRKLSQQVRLMRGMGGKGGSDKRMSFLSSLEVWLRRADIKTPVKDYVLRWVATVGTLTVLSLLSPATRIGVLLVPISFVGTAFYLRMRMQRRLSQFNDGLYDMLILVSNALRAGHSFVQALHMIVEETVGPMREEFRRAEAEMQVGVVLEDALARTAERVGSEDFDLIVTAIAIQRQIGGNLAEVLDKIADTIGERVKLKREIKALTSQGRLSAAIFMGLPAAVAILLYLMNPAYMSVLFQTSLGLLTVVVAIVSQSVGFLVIRKIVNVQL